MKIYQVRNVLEINLVRRALKRKLTKMFVVVMDETLVVSLQTFTAGDCDYT